MAIGALLAKATVGSEVARNGLVNTVKGIGDILAGIRTGIITVVQDIQKATGNWVEPKEDTTKKKVKGGENNVHGN